jgi:hypothetical protein
MGQQLPILSQRRPIQPSIQALDRVLQPSTKQCRNDTRPSCIGVVAYRLPIAKNTVFLLDGTVAISSSSSGASTLINSELDARPHSIRFQRADSILAARVASSKFKVKEKSRMWPKYNRLRRIGSIDCLIGPQGAYHEKAHASKCGACGDVIYPPLATFQSSGECRFSPQVFNLYRVPL